MGLSKEGGNLPLPFARVWTIRPYPFSKGELSRADAGGEEGEAVEVERNNMESRSPSPLPSPPGRGNSNRVTLNFRKSVRLSPLDGGAKRGVDKWRDGLATHHGGERFSLSPGERVRVRASVHLTSSGNARRELEKKSGRKVVTNENYLALSLAAKKAKRLKG